MRSRSRAGSNHLCGKHGSPDRKVGEVHNAVPLLDETEWKPTGDVMDMIAKVDGLRGNVTRDLLDEGIVWHAKAGERLSDGLYNELGSNRCFKIINNKYLTKHGL